MRVFLTALILLLASACWGQGLSFHDDIPIVERVVCPCCKEEGRTSTVTCWGTSGTLMYSPTWYDSLGSPHHKDPNYYTTRYECSRGHRFSITKKAGESPTISKQCSTLRPTWTIEQCKAARDSAQATRIVSGLPVTDVDYASQGFLKEVAASDSARLDSTIRSIVRDEFRRWGVVHGRNGGWTTQWPIDTTGRK